MRDLRVELQSPHARLQVLYGYELRVLRAPALCESLGHRVELVPVGHPHDELFGETLEEEHVLPVLGVALDGGLPVLPLLTWGDLAAVDVRELLHAVADP